MHMRKFVVLILDILFIAGFLYTGRTYTQEHVQWHVDNSIESFEEVTKGLSGLLTNYLLGEQKICNNWARYINGEHLTMEQAIEFLHVSERDDIMAHVIYMDDGTYSGLSTISSGENENLNSVSYAHLDVLESIDLSAFSEDKIDALRVFVNPINNERSFGFYHPVTLYDAETETERSALLIRIVKVSEVEAQAEYLSGKYADLEVAMIDQDGDYILKGEEFRYNNFFDWIKKESSRNQEDYKALISKKAGHFVVQDHEGEKNVVAYTPMEYRSDRVLLTFLPYNALVKNSDLTRKLMLYAAGIVLMTLFHLYEIFVYDKRLRTQKKTTDKVMRDRTNFIRTMAHQVNNSMNVITGFSAVALGDVESVPLVRHHLKEIGRTSNNLVGLISDIRDTYDSDKGQFVLHPTTFNIVECADNLSSLAGQYMKNKHTDFNFYISSIEHEILYADKIRLNQVFLNILLNALQYTDEGGTVTAELREDVGHDPSVVRLIYTVSDNGIGMSKTFQKRMYEPFTREDNPKVQAIEGNGMGLAIAKQIIDLKHGTISCKSAPNKGTTFIVTLELPIGETNVEEMTIPSAHVLVVDEQQKMLLTAQETLYSIGVVADISSEPEEALKMIQSEHEEGEDYDIVIIDGMICRKDRFAFARKIREIMQEHTPKLLLSTYEGSDLIKDATEAGFTSLISKPLFRFTMYWKLCEVLGLKQTAVDEYSHFQGMHVLVAEDNKLNGEIITSILDNFGITSEYVENGQQAVDRLVKARDMEFTLVLMDIRMPVLGGIEAAAAIRALPSAVRHIPIIAMSGDYSESLQEEINNTEINGFLPKPIDHNQLKAELLKIREEMARNRATSGKHHNGKEEPSVS